MSRAPTLRGGLRPAPGSAPGSGLSSCDEDDLPTKPNNYVEPELLDLVRLVDSMPAVERRRFLRMVQQYGRCSTEKRVLVAELVRALAGKD